MDRFEIRNYGPTTGLIYGGVFMNFWAGGKPQYTDDPELAEAAGKLKYVEVVDREPEILDDMTIKELYKKARKLGISGMSGKPKAEIIKSIMSTEEASTAPVGMEV